MGARAGSGRLTALSFATFLLVSLASVACGPGPPPNLVLIIGDDHGWRDFGFMGSQNVRTPNLDRLAEQGTVFVNGHSTSSICRPALRSLLTGLQPFQWTSYRSQRLRAGDRRPENQLMQDFDTLPGLLAAAGYRSFQGGKLFEESYRVAGFSHGVDESPEMPGLGGMGGRIGRRNLEPVLDFIDEFGDEPFFLWFAPMLPHVPHNASWNLRRNYRGRGFSKDAVGYYASIERFDDRVGELLQHLETRGLRDNTLIVYLADNGWDQGPNDVQPEPNRDGPRGKMTLYETGTRTPIVFNWPGHVPEGIERDEIVSLVDIPPSLLGFAGAPPLAGRGGLDLRPLLEGGNAWRRERAVGSLTMPRANAFRPSSLPPQHINQLETGYFVRDARWRFIWNESWGSMELYDIEQDPDQNHDLAAQQPELAAEYRKLVEGWRVAALDALDQMPKRD